MTICKIIYNQPQAQSNFSIFMCDLDTWLIRERGNIKGYTVINSIDSINHSIKEIECNILIRFQNALDNT